MKRFLSLLVSATVGAVGLGVLITPLAIASQARLTAQSGSTPSVPIESSLVNTEWLLEDLGGAGVLDRVQTTLRFNDANRISGQGGCNRYNAQAQLKGDRFTVGVVAATKKLCPPAVMHQETRYFQFLQKAERISLQGPYLLVYSLEESAPLKFTQLDVTGQAQTLPVVFEGRRNVVRVFTQNGQTKINVYDKRDKTTWMRGNPAAVEQTSEGNQYTNTQGEAKVIVFVPRSGQPTLSINGVADR